MKNYKLACCDCGLVHDMEFKVIKATKSAKNGTFTYSDVKGFRVMFRAKRNSRSTGQLRRHKKPTAPVPSPEAC